MALLAVPDHLAQAARTAGELAAATAAAPGPLARLLATSPWHATEFTRT